MKVSIIAATLAAAGLVVSEPHRHRHQHRHHNKRNPDIGPDIVIEYELNGHKVPASQVCEGIADGTLMWADGHAPPGACQSSSPTPAPTPTPTPSPAAFIEESVESSSTSTPPPPPPPTISSESLPTSSSEPLSTSSLESSSALSPKLSSTLSPEPTPTPSPESAPSPARSSGGSSGATGLDADFPDGQIDCSTFPSDYGAVPLDYLGLGGWAGIQYVSIVGDLVNSIVTAVTGDTCRDGSMCSYACPPGYQKSQWPSTQGATGQSVGGIQCRGGKLYLTNPGLSNKLCIPGVGGVFVQNTMSENVAICRTDYPGTESETIPLAMSGQTTQPLTCPNGADYYHWQGKTTSAQYYVNPKGISIEEACQWGNGDQPIGNWAPVNFGVGENNGKWLSVFQNSPTTNEKLDFNVKIQGDNLGGSCRYENGVFYSESGSNDSGCTVEVLSGDAYYVLY